MRFFCCHKRSSRKESNKQKANTLPLSEHVISDYCVSTSFGPRNISGEDKPNLIDFCYSIIPYSSSESLSNPGDRWSEVHNHHGDLIGVKHILYSKEHKIRVKLDFDTKLHYGITAEDVKRVEEISIGYGKPDSIFYNEERRLKRTTQSYSYRLQGLPLKEYLESQTSIPNVSEFLNDYNQLHFSETCVVELDRQAHLATKEASEVMKM